MKQKSSLLEKINKTNKPIERLTKNERRQESLILVIKQAASKNPTDIKRQIRDYCEQYYIHTFDPIDGKDQFLKKHKLKKKKHKLLQLIQYEVDNLNDVLTIKEIEFIILELPE